jgi:hypothetical protein
MLEGQNALICSIFNTLEDFHTPRQTQFARFCHAKFPVFIKTNIYKMQLLSTKVLWNFSICIEFRMHFLILIANFLGFGMSLEAITSYRNQTIFMKHQRTVLLLSRNCHTNWKCFFEVSVDIHNKSVPGRIRTCDLLLRRQLLYPTELQRQRNVGGFLRQHFRSRE